MLVIVLLSIIIFLFLLIFTIFILTFHYEKVKSGAKNRYNYPLEINVLKKIIQILFL